MKNLQLKLKFLSFMLFSFIAFSYAQDKSPAHLGVFYPISTHGTEAANYTNNFSLHLFAGLSGGESGAAIYGLAGMVKGDVQGTQISGLWNNVTGNVTGVQVAGIFNQSADATKAAQFAGIGTINRGNSAFQGSGIFNTAKLVNGAQMAGVLNIADRIDGVQLAGIVNISPEITGSQVAGIASVSKNVTGIQIAGISNVAEHVRGTQIAGLVNSAKTVTGLQVGLINIADSSDYTIGLINLVGNGEKKIGISVDEHLNSFLTFRSGGKRVYGIFGLGTHFGTKDLPFGFEGGLGLNLTESDLFRLDIEGVSKYLTNFQDNAFAKFSVQLLPTMKISQSIHIFAGPSISYLYAEEWNKMKHAGLTIWDETWDEDYQAILLGFTAGVNVRF